MDYQWTTTTFEMPGCRVVRNLGVVRGVTVRSAHLGSQIAAGFRSLGGGRIDEYVEIGKSFFEGPEPGVINGVLDSFAREARA